MPVCVECGQENPAGARFCTACAASLGAEHQPAREERKVVRVFFADLATVSTRWLDAAGTYASGAFEEAADVYAEIGSVPDEAFARLRAAEALVAAGRRPEADAQLQQALAFYRSVGATVYIREAESLFAVSA
jgi:hypothetical protein